ncbi:MAG: glycosyltransferase family 2 protein [Spirochaetes bacterium]|nr:glycosyltransferase family 2 protein [Spirochaetota bacterium]
MNISIIIPCYNEEQVINETYNRVAQVCKDHFQNYEILFINDGSHDNTFKLLEEIAVADLSVKLISFSRNFGHQAAVSAGLKNCTGDVAFIIDADLQDPPEVFPDMLKIYQKEKCNVVYGVRKKREKETLFKKITAKMFYRLVNFLSDIDLPLDTGDFRLIDRKVINNFNQLTEKNKYIRGLMCWVGFQQKPFYYYRSAREVGETKYTLRKMLALAMHGIFYFTKRPLKISMTLGTFSITLSFALVIYVFFSKYFRNIEAIPGWASTLIVIIFFGGVQLFMIGILGEYIGNIFDEIKNRPEFIIDKKTNFEEETKKEN